MRRLFPSPSAGDGDEYKASSDRDSEQEMTAMIFRRNDDASFAHIEVVDARDLEHPEVGPSRTPARGIPLSVRPAESLSTSDLHLESVP